MNRYFYMPVSTWMCHASWVRASLTNSAWYSPWPMGQTQLLCEISTWPVTFSLEESKKRCFFSKGRLLHLSSLGRWVASLKGHKEGQTSPWGLTAPPPGSCRCCRWATQNMSMCTAVFISQSCTTTLYDFVCMKSPFLYYKWNTNLLSYGRRNI